MIDYKDMLQKDNSGFKTDPNLLAPVVEIAGSTGIIIDEAEDNAGVQIKIPPSKDLKDGLKCMLLLTADKDHPVESYTSIDVVPDKFFIIKNGSSETVVTSVPGEFARATTSIGTTVYLFYCFVNPQNRRETFLSELSTKITIRIEVPPTENGNRVR